MTRKTRMFFWGLMATAFAASTASSQVEGDIRFSAPGELIADSGSGLAESKVYYPDIRFPIENGPAYLNSQVYNPGGYPGGIPIGGSQCDAKNYAYPWVDNFCETRPWQNGLCPSGKGHQGVDIRPRICQRNVEWAVAVEDGVIGQIGSYSVTLQTPAGTLYRYLHLDKDSLVVNALDSVSKGDRIGKVSNYFGDSQTTIHLHFDIKDTIEVNGVQTKTYIPPYASLVEAYKRLVPLVVASPTETEVNCAGNPGGCLVGVMQR